MKPTNYVQIQGWMVSDLGLKGNNLFAYALIYGFSQDGNSQFTGSINYVSRWLNCSRSTAIKVLKDLTNQKLLIKEQVTINSVTYNKYSVKFPNTRSAENIPPVQKLDNGSTEVEVQGSTETAPNNAIINNTTYTKDQFVKDWNAFRTKHLKKPSHLLGLNREDESNFKELMTYANREQVCQGLIGLFKQKKMPNGNTTMQSNPKHFLTHFNAYLTAYHDKNSSLYGREIQENL